MTEPTDPTRPDAQTHDPPTAHSAGPFSPKSPTKHRRHRRRVHQDLRHALPLLTEDPEATIDALELTPHRKERINGYE